MNVLQLCHRVPFPANDGGNIAMVNLADSLISQNVHLKTLALNTKKHHVDTGALSDKIKSRYFLEAVPIDTGIRIGAALANLFKAASYNVSRFYSQDFEKKLLATLSSNDYDVVLMESLFMTVYIPAIRKAGGAKIVLRAHNVESVIWQRLAENEKGFLKRSYLSLLAKRLRNYEADVLNQVDGILPITAEDENIFREWGCRVPMKVTPVGIDSGEYALQINPQNELCLFHLGAMDWRPNLEGIEWFLDECWKLIHDKFPKLKLFLAGRGFPAGLMGRGDPNVKCEGEIKDAREFMKDKQMMIVPLKSGGGMRVKIIQGMALGKTIISTSIGAEGISYVSGKNILIADTPDEILTQIEKCLDDKEECFRIGREARKLAIENYSSEVIGKKVADFFNSLQ